MREGKREPVLYFTLLFQVAKFRPVPSAHEAFGCFAGPTNYFSAPSFCIAFTS